MSDAPLRRLTGLLEWSDDEGTRISPAYDRIASIRPAPLPTHPPITEIPPMFALADAPLYRVPSESEGDASRRIASILPFLTDRARRWLRRLPGWARALLAVEDVPQQTWTELMAKHRHFDPSRASYPSFAGVVVDRLLQHLGDRLCRGPRRKPLEADLGDGRAGTPGSRSSGGWPASGPLKPSGGPSAAWTIAANSSSPRATASPGSR
jgi:hypothetical protein